MIYVLIFIVATSTSGQSGTGVTTQEFNNEMACLSAGMIMSEQAARNGAFSAIRYGCFPKGRN